MLAAVTEVIRGQGGKETETEYFAALVSAAFLNMSTKTFPNNSSLVLMCLVSMLFVDDHPGSCGFSRVTGCSGVSPQPCHETVGLNHPSFSKTRKHHSCQN